MEYIKATKKAKEALNLTVNLAKSSDKNVRLETEKCHGKTLLLLLVMKAIGSANANAAR